MVSVDARDLAILSVLARQGRITKAELAEHAGLGTTACADRLARLEREGVVAGYRAQIALKTLGPHLEVFVTVELKNHNAAAFQTFERAVAQEREIVQCWALGGGLDYLMHIVCRDVDAYQRFMDHLLDRRIGLSRYFTYIVTKSVKEAPVDLAQLLA